MLVFISICVKGHAQDSFLENKDVSSK